MVKTSNTLHRLTIFLFIFCMAMQAHAASITATVDRSIVQEGESLQLTLEARGDVDDGPEFGPLQKDFDILSRQKGSSMQIINGQVSSKTQWSLTLMPRHKGELRIPAISFGNDQSNPLTITVKTAQSTQTDSVAQDVFMQVSATPQKSYVQAEIIYTVRIFLAVNINNARLSEPGLSDADAVIEKLGEDKRYQTNHQGRRYQVLERQYAIFPQRSGKLRIEPVVFTAQLIDNSRYMFNPFSQQGQTKRLRSRAIEIDIRPIPQQQKSSHWIPARKLTLQEQWPTEPPKFKVGEAVTRTLSLTAEGLTAAQLPEIRLATPDGFKSYPDQATLNNQHTQTGIIGRRQEKIAMIATQPGHYVLPAITIHWWNTKTQRGEITQLAERKIEVIAADIAVKIPQTKLPEIKQAARSETAQSIETPNTAPQTTVAAGAAFWPWISLTLAIGWLFTIFIVWQQRQKIKHTQNNPVTEKPVADPISLRTVENNIKQACQANNANAAKDAILQWGKLRCPDHKLTAITDLGRQLGGDIETHINMLNRSLYSRSTNTWQGQALWQSFQDHKQQKSKPQSDKATSLPSLYP